MHDHIQIDPTISEQFSDKKLFLARVSQACFLSKSGGPYPKSELYEPVSWETTLERLCSYVLDVNTTFNLDKLVYDGYAMSLPHRNAKGILGKTLAYIGISAVADEQRRIWRQVGDRIDECQRAWRGNLWVSRGVIAEHLSFLLGVVGALIVVSRISENPMLILAASSAFDGYIPVDIVFEGEKPRVQIY